MTGGNCAFQVVGFWLLSNYCVFVEFAHPPEGVSSVGLKVGKVGAVVVQKETMALAEGNQQPT